MRSQMTHRQRAIQMQLATAAVIEEAVRDIRLLLNLANREPRADRVHSPSGDEKSVAWPGVEPLEHSHDRSVERASTGLFARHGLAESGGNLRAGLGFQHVPHFGFARGTVVEPRVLI